MKRLHMPFALGVELFNPAKAFSNVSTYSAFI